MPDLTETLGRAGVNLSEALAGEDDLDRVQRAVERERAIRAGMARTGEGREVVAEMLDAINAMGQEAVLDLTEGEPTTLRDALARYVRSMSDQLIDDDPNDEGLGPRSPFAEAVSDLTVLLEYPWQGEEERLASHRLNTSLRLHIERPDDETLRVSIGDNRWPLFTATHEEHGWAGMQALEFLAHGLHRAVLGRVIGDRDHSVQINGSEVASLLAWAVNSSGGSWSPSVSSRLSVNAVSGGGWLVRTRPYAWQYAVNEEQRRIKEAETDG